MSNEIDERIVQMQFNNQQFENGVKESLGTIEKLKKGLQLDESAKNLAALQSAGDKFSLAGIANGVDTIASKFSAFGIMGITMLSNLTTAAVNAGTQIVKSLTIDPIFEGYGDYNRKLTSVQTITSATGKTIAEVEPFFSELDTYADKTIYNLDDMTSSLAKFTNAGVDLDKSVPAIKGIANMVALAGQDAGAAQVAMYNLSQSIAGGFLTTMDYRALNTANVATQEWKQNMVDGAVAAGTLIEVSDGMYQDTAGQIKEATSMQKLFTEELSSGWATTDVLLNVLGQYGDTTTDIGKKAQAAAQDVKSYGMMMETLKAAVGTGWTESFENIIGNLDESKVLWTGLTNVIGGFVDSTSASRNAILKFWKDNGGRDKLIKGISDAFSELSRILKPLKGAFDKVFPPMTGETLLKLSNNFADFLSNLKMGDKDLANLTRVASGFFSTLKLGEKGISLLFTGLKKVLTWLQPLGSAILDITANFGDFVSGINRVTDSTSIFSFALGKISKTVSIASDTISNGFESIKQRTSDIPDEVSKNFEKLSKVFDKLKNIDTSGIDAFIADIKKKFTSVDSAIEVGKSAMEKIKGVMSKMAPFFKGVGDKLRELGQSLNIDDILNIAKTGGLLALISTVDSSLKAFTGSLTGFINSIKTITDNVGNFLKGITDILDSVRECLKAYQNDIKANTILKIAAAVGILAFAITMLSQIDPMALAAAVSALAVLLTELMGSMAAFEKIVNDKGFKSMMTLVVGLVGLAIAIQMLSDAVQVLSGLDLEKLATGMAGVTGLLVEMIGTAQFIGKNSSGMVSAGIGLVLFAGSIRMLTTAVIDLSKLSLEQLAKGLGAVISLCVTLTLIMKNGDFSGAGLKMGVGLLLLAGAIGILAYAVADLGKMDVTQLGVGLLAVSVLMLAIVAFTRVVGEGTGLIETGVAMVFIAGAMLIFSQAVQMLGSMPMEQLAAGMIAMAVGLAIMVGALEALPKDILVSAAAFLVMSVGLIAMAFAIQMLGSMSMDQIGTALVGLGGALLFLIVAVNAMNGAIVGAAALLVVSVALIALAVALTILGALSLEKIGIALLGLVAVLVVFAVAALALTPILIPMAALAAIMLVLGVAMIAIGAAAIVMAIGMTMLSAVGMAGVGVMLAVVLAMTPLIALSPGLLLLGVALIGVSVGVMLLGAGLLLLGAGLVSVAAIGPEGVATLTKLGSLAVMISNFGAQILVAGAGLLLFGAGAMLAGVGSLIGGLGLMVLSKALKDFMKLDFTSFTGMATFAAEILAASVMLLLAAPGLLAGGNALITFGVGAVLAGVGLKSITTNIMGTLDSLKQAPDAVKNYGGAILSGVTALMNGINTAILTKGGTTKTVLIGICVQATTSINSQKYLFTNAGINVVDGFISGIKSRTSAAVEAAKAMALSAANATKSTLDIHSPSGVFEDFGMYSDQGFANGLLKYASLAVNAAKDLATATFTPVMDMSLTNGFDTVGKTFSTPPTSTVPEISNNLQNGGAMQKTLASLSDLANSNSASSTTDLSGTLTIQVVNDKGEIIGIAEQAIKDLLRRESR